MRSCARYGNSKAVDGKVLSSGNGTVQKSGELKFMMPGRTDTKYQKVNANVVN